MKKIILAAAAMMAATVMSAPGKTEVVAEGYPAWINIDAKHYVSGRELVPADLRHKITVVVEVDADANLATHIAKIGEIANLNPEAQPSHGATWESKVMQRNLIVAISLRGGKNAAETFKKALTPPKDANEATRKNYSALQSLVTPVYSDLTFDGAPVSDGKRPFVYVLGPSGKTVLYQGTLDAKGLKDASAAVTAERTKMRKDGFKWTQFYGTLTEDKYPPLLVKTMTAGKNAKTCPLSSVMATLQKDIASKDAEKAKIAQIACDALEQTRSDLIVRIRLESGACPHQGAYDMATLLKYWPMEKKRVAAAAAKLKASPEFSKLAQIYCKLKVWDDPDFVCKNAGESKQIVAELNKMKKDLTKMKSSQNMTVQNGAMLMEMKIDDLISIIPSKIK